MRPTQDILQAAKSVSSLAPLSEAVKNQALHAMADSLEASADEILSANREDVQRASGTISETMIDRLRLDRNRISAMAEGIRAVSRLPDPIGEELSRVKRENGLVIRKVCVPIGVVAIIYESRPNVTSDAAALCFKSGNVSVLRSGKEAFSSSYAITKALQKGLKNCGLSEHYMNLIEDTSRQSANDLMNATGFVDLLIPRGGKGLIKACTDHAKVPCIETGTGICHIYIHRDADLNKALDIVENAKASRPSVCNAAEVCLVDAEIADVFLPMLSQRLCNSKYGHSVEIRGDSRTRNVIPAVPATDEDYDTEFLDYILAVKVVSDVCEAVKHISLHSTHHSEAIVTENTDAADYFTRNVDSAAVYVNASTRFTDGGEFGLGCEMGISTQKLHARGPMGLRELTSYKYIINGNGNIR